MIWLMLILASVRAESPDLELAERAVAANPGLDALEARTDALAERARVAGAWSDPVVSFEISNAPVNSFALDRHPMSGLQLRVQQQVRPARWSRLRRDRHREQVAAARHATDEAALALRARVLRTYWTLARVRGLRQLTEDQAARADELFSSVRVQFETGAVGQYAVLRLDVLRNRLRDDVGDFARAEAELVAGLNAALASDGGRYPTPTAIEPRPPPTETDWLALADVHRPALRQLVAEREAASQSATLAKVEARPSPVVWAGYRIRLIDTVDDAGTDFASLGVGVPVPSGSARRARGDRAASLEEVAAAEAAARALRDGIRSEMAAIVATWQRAEAKATTYGERLIPAAQAALDTARADFAVGRAAFASLFEAEVELIDLERARLQAAVETELQRAMALEVLGTLPPGAQP